MITQNKLAVNDEGVLQITYTIEQSEIVKLNLKVGGKKAWTN
jgi:hypothetical protein